jgi:LysM repeat protein
VQKVVVQPGDSLWSIAQRVAPGHDPRAVVAAIAARHPATVVVGETLTVPTP